MTIGSIVCSGVSAQDRIRSTDYSGAAVEQCYEWETGFEFDKCARRPLPGDSGTVAQIYKLVDGTQRTLTQDPGTAMASSEDPSNPVEETVVEQPINDAAPGKGASGSNNINVTEPGDPAVIETNVVEDVEAETPQPDSSIEPLLPPVVEVRPDRAEILPVATGHLNRIDTPFGDPVARAASGQDNTLDIQFDQNFIYVSVTQPVTLFINDRGYPDPAIAVSLVPHRIAPRQVRLTLPSSQMEIVRKNANAAPKKPTPASGAVSRAGGEPKPNSRGVRRTSPGADPAAKIAGLVQTFAKGSVPSGFAQVAVQGHEVASFCKKISGVRFDFRQGAAVASKDYLILRGMASATRKVSLSELDCALNPQTLAVAFSPRTEIGPRQPTDFFVLLRQSNVTTPTARAKE